MNAHNKKYAGCNKKKIIMSITIYTRPTSLSKRTKQRPA